MSTRRGIIDEPAAQIRRRAAHSTVVHDRARRLAAERVDTWLETSDNRWLDEHLASCDVCRSVAAAYQADRVILRRLRDNRPVPPRDLWARTSAAIERESRGRRARRARSARFGQLPAFGALSGVAVIAVVIGATILSQRPVGGPVTAGASPAASGGIAVTPTRDPEPTPIVVGAGSVDWIGTADNGELAYNSTEVGSVCPADRQPDCARVAAIDPKRVNLSIRPKSVSKSPRQNQAVVVGTDAAGGDSVVVIALPTDRPTATPSVTATPSPTPDGTKSPPPGSDPTPEPTPIASPTITPEPTVAATLALVSDVKVVGQSAAYSPDGSWFAFSARPSDGSVGPDIYVWTVGDRAARRLTDDHTSVFASWVGGRVLGSHTVPDGDATGIGSPSSFFIDPSTGKQVAIDGQAWRPTVDPTGTWVIAWDGTVKYGPVGLTAVPADGSLVLRGFDRHSGFSDVHGRALPLADAPFAEFDVRWDETGEWFAVWLADPSDPSIGRLSLVHVDPASGRMDRPDGAPRDVTARPGFSIRDGRLAWATPPGQGGEGSRVQIVAWTGMTVGAVESGPVEDVVLVH